MLTVFDAFIHRLTTDSFGCADVSSRLITLKAQSELDYGVIMSATSVNVEIKHVS